MAALRNFDVLVVNPVYDGLSLVVKEGALVNRSDGVIVLSENAGTAEELYPHVLSTNPFDIMTTARRASRHRDERRRQEAAQQCSARCGPRQ